MFIAFLIKFQGNLLVFYSCLAVPLLEGICYHNQEITLRSTEKNVPGHVKNLPKHARFVQQEQVLSVILPRPIRETVDNNKYLKLE